MRTTTSSRLLFAIALPLAYATDLIQHIQVGHNGSFNFTPDTVFSPPGTTLNFIFHGYPHSVAQSSFEKPCLPLPNGIFSGHIADEKYENELSVSQMTMHLAQDAKRSALDSERHFWSS